MFGCMIDKKFFGYTFASIHLKNLLYLSIFVFDQIKA